jgi:hypothetical protein
MESLTGTTGKDLLLPYLLPYFQNIGFEYKKSRNKDLVFKRKTNGGLDTVYISSNNYSPSITFYFNLEKTIDSVEQFADLFKKKIGEEIIHRDTIRIMALGPDKRGYMNLPFCSNESHIKETADIIIDYCNRVYLPILDKNDNIVEFDNLINGEDKWWADQGLDKSKPFSMEGFYYKRFIVAKLAGRENIQELYDYSKQTFENFAKDQDWDDEYKIYNNGWFDIIMDILKDVNISK